MLLDRPKRAHLYGIDPGSGKAWAVYHACIDLEAGKLTEQPTFAQWERTSLDGHIRELLNKTGEGSTTSVLAIDVPVVTPHEFLPAYIGCDSKQYPFNVEPFTMRPCECALRSHPTVIDRSLAHLDLTSMIGKLCGWGQPFKQSSNTPFHKLASCEGISVMIFSEAPHQPLMRVFAETLASSAGEITISTTPTTAGSLSSSHIYVLESHPAVSMGFWRMDGRFCDTLPKIPRYKGTLKGEEYEDMTADEKSEMLRANLIELADNVVTLAVAAHGLDSPEPITNDDRLDAFVGLVNLLDLVAGHGDWFGTAASGYFLVPKLKLLEGKLFSEAWEKAEVIVRQENNRRDS